MSAFWSVGRRNRASKFWRHLIQLKPVLQQNILWKVGSGESIQIFSQPWFPSWLSFRACTKEQREATVASLIDPITKNWDFQALQFRFGFTVALLVSTNDKLRPNQNNAPDAMFFTFAKNGQFTVKMAYQLLRGVRGDGRDKKFWGWLWRKSPLMPKLRTFVWRSMQTALPVRAILAVRIHQIDPTCPFCGNQLETIMHALFKCEFPRAVWLISDLGLRTDNLPDSFSVFFESVWESLSDDQSCYLVFLMWAIWKSRNEALFKQERQTMQNCKAFLKTAQQSCWNAILTTPPNHPCAQAEAIAVLEGIKMLQELANGGRDNSI